MENTNLDNLNGVNNGEATGTTAKKGILDRFLAGYHKFRATKAGKWIVRGTKAATAGGALYFTYKAGQKSVKPTTVYIREGVTEDDEVQEPEPQEETEEKTEE